jgi:glutamate dehydrogenase (NADP+)
MTRRAPTNQEGIDPDLLKEIKAVRRDRIAVYAKARGGASRYTDGGSIWDVPCAVTMSSATQNALTGKDVRTLVQNFVVAVGESANMPHSRGG